MTCSSAPHLSGADRYATAAQISYQHGWEHDDTTAVFLASGANFPDATRAELARIRPCSIVVAGGAPSVSDAVVADAEQYVDHAGCDTC